MYCRDTVSFVGEGQELTVLPPLQELYRASLALDSGQTRVAAALARLTNPMRNRFALLVGPASAGLAFAGDAVVLSNTLRAIGMEDDHVITLAGEQATAAVGIIEKRLYI